METLTNIGLAFLIILWIWDNRKLEKRMKAIEDFAQKISVASDTMARRYIEELEKNP